MWGKVCSLRKQHDDMDWVSNHRPSDLKFNAALRKNHKENITCFQIYANCDMHINYRKEFVSKCLDENGGPNRNNLRVENEANEQGDPSVLSEKIIFQAENFLIT